MEQKKLILLPSRFSGCDKVHGNLWMGGAPPVGGSVEEHFDCLILMAREYQPHQDCFTDIHVHHAPIEDGLLSKEQLVMIFHAAAVAKDFLDSGRKVLVTCYAGLNRSGLVCALAACTTKNETLSLEKAIESIRNARGPSALHNQHFISFLKKWDMARKMKAAGNMWLGIEGKKKWIY